MNHSLTLDALRALDAIDRKGSFAAAAEALFKVPSALTYTIKKLEDDLGTQLFDRSKQRAVLTPAGRIVLEQGREILHSTNQLVTAVEQLESGWEKQIRLARDTVIPECTLFSIIKEFVKLPQSVDISIMEESLGGGWDALLSKRADVVVGVSGELPKGMFNIHQIGKVEFVFAVPPEHPLADVEGILEIEQLSEFPSVVVADTSLLLPERDSGLFMSKQVIRVKDMESKVRAQKQGLGIGFLPLHMIRSFLEDGSLVQKDCVVPRPSQNLYVAWNKGQEGEALKWFVDKFCSYDWNLQL